MYRLMKSKRFTLINLDSGSVSFSRQIQVSKFQKLSEALATCKTANNEAGTRYFVLNDLGKEYYKGTWID